MGEYRRVRLCMICREAFDAPDSRESFENFLNPEKEKFVCDKCYEAIMRVRKQIEKEG